jgi:LAS superfamily LD-carboxypeptidase LdcB
MRHKFLLFVVVCAVVGGGLLVWHKDSAEAPAKDSTAHPGVTTNNSFNKTAFSLTDPASIWVIANKQHPLQPKDYIPTDLVVPSVPLRVPGNESMQLRQVAATALEQMFQAAQKDGIQLMLSSGYRSYTYQVNLQKREGGWQKTRIVSGSLFGILPRMLILQDMKNRNHGTSGS